MNVENKANDREVGEEPDGDFKEPLTLGLVSRRINELQRSDNATPHSPLNNNNGTDSPDWPTPIFMKKDSTVKPQMYLNLDPAQIYAALRTPGEVTISPDDERFARQVAQMCKNMVEGNVVSRHEAATPPIVFSFEKERMERLGGSIGLEDEDRSPPTPLDEKQIKTVLKGVTIYVCKKLAKQQAELNKIVLSLGGDHILCTITTSVRILSMRARWTTSALAKSL